MNLFAKASLLLSATLFAGAARAQQQWIQPTPEELHMTSIPEVPGAKAVVLNREELTDDDNHMRSRYFRIKILADAGKDLGDVHILFDRRSDGRGYSVSEIAGRTIQPDGTVVPFTGKPYEKVLEKTKESQITGKVFSMPAVQVGSIIEYRYKLRWEDNLFWSPYWDIQTDLFLRKGHFLWKPTDKELTHSSRGREATTSTLVWDPVLPKGTEVKRTNLPNGRLNLEVNIQNVPPFATDEYMPPMQSSIYHVYFYYSPYHTAQEFWSTEGKYWSSDVNKFIGNSSFVRDAAQEAVAGATTDEQKLQKLYALTGRIENTDYTRKRSTQEEKNAGLKETRTAEDVLRRKRGTSDEITRTFVALARAAGMNASVMIVADRGERIVNVSWLEFGQLTDEIAIVNYGGADHFYDPGSPLTEFEHMHWTHTATAGVRQQSKDTAIVRSPMENYKYSRTTRVADLKLDDTGGLAGTVTLTYSGSPAARVRQRALRTDEAEVREDLKKQMETTLPGGSEVEVKSVENLTEGDKPIKVVYQVKGNMGTLAGSRLVLPGDVFVAAGKPTFPHEKREQGVYFNFPEVTQDATRITYPAGYTVESVPPDTQAKYKTFAAYSERSKQTGSSVTVWRDYTLGEFYFPLEDFPDLRTFYNDFERKDHSSVVLKHTGEQKASVDSH